MVVRMQAREERKREYHGRAVIDLHLRLRRSSRKLRGKWGFEGGAPPSWRCTGCVGSAGEGNGGVWRHGCGGGFLLPNVGVPWTGCTRGARGWESTSLAVVLCGYGVGLLCWGSEGESGRVWLGSELGTHGIHGGSAECDGSMASLQGSRGGVGVSAKLRGDRSALVTRHTSWGAVVEKSGVGVHARP